MKKLFIPLIATLFLSACHIDNYDVVKEGADITTYEIDAYNNEWIDSKEGEGNAGFYVFQQFDFPEITDEVFRKGSVLVYMVEKKQDYTAKHILPYVYPRDIVERDNHGQIVNRFQIMQNIRYEVEPGLLTIAVEWQDFVKCDLENFKFSVCIIKPGKRY